MARKVLFIMGLMLWSAPAVAQDDGLACLMLARVLDLDASACQGAEMVDQAAAPAPTSPSVDPAPVTGVAPPAHIAVAQLPPALPRVPNTISFQFGGSDLSASAQDDLQRVAAILRDPRLAATCLRLVGHSDAVGEAEANQRLGQRRAEAVGQYLSDQVAGLTLRLQITSAGEDQPLPDLAPTDGRNRRVDIWARPCAAG